MICLALVVLPGARAPASIALCVIEARKPLHEKVVVVEEEYFMLRINNYFGCRD
jgi:hypothetical protein